MSGQGANTRSQAISGLSFNSLLLVLPIEDHRIELLQAPMRVPWRRRRRANIVRISVWSAIGLTALLLAGLSPVFAGAGRVSSRTRLLAGLAIGMILFAVATQKWSDVRQREMEAEMFARAREIQLALIRYQRDRGTLPVEFKQLIEPGTRGQYFIRKLYKDPLSKDGKWGLLRQGPGGQVFDPYRTETPEADLLGTSQNTPTGGPTSGVAGLSTGDPGDVAGGLPIIGVKTLCTEPPFRFYNDHTEYPEMLFTILDFTGGRQGQPGQPGAIAPGGNNPSAPLVAPPKPPGG